MSAFFPVPVSVGEKLQLQIFFAPSVRCSGRMALGKVCCEKKKPLHWILLQPLLPAVVWKLNATPYCGCFGFSVATHFFDFFSVASRTTRTPETTTERSATTTTRD